MLSIAEEILLLALDDKKGTWIHGSDTHLGFAVSGAILMDLVFANRIDTDLERLFVIDPSPTGDENLDEVLGTIAARDSQRPTEYWLREINADADAIRNRLLDRMIAAGILRRVEKTVLGMFRRERYPAVDSREEREVKLRIAGILCSDEIPDPRDIVIISLVQACGLLGTILTAWGVTHVLPRAELIARMDLIGRVVRNTIREVEASINVVMPKP